MKKKTFRVTVCILAALAGLTAVGIMAAGGAGSQSDPLVTLSYLTDTFTTQVMDKVDKLIVERNTKLASELEGGGASVSGGAYASVTLSAGQTMTGETGCEVLLLSGTATCSASASPAMTDATSGGSINNGAALQPNHLYLMTGRRSVTTSGGASLLVRGSYAVQ